MYSATILSGLAFAGFSIAQSTISLFIPGADDQSLIASIIASDATATTYTLACSNQDECGFPNGVTLTEGPSTAIMTISADIEAGDSSISTIVAVTGFLDCSLAESSAVCTQSFSGQQNDQASGTSTNTFSGTDYTQMPVVLTDGPLPNASAAPSNTNAAPTATNTGAAESSSDSGSTTGGGASNTSGASSKTSGSAQTKGASSTSTGGVPMMTGNAKWVLGGAALLAALA